MLICRGTASGSDDLYHILVHRDILDTVNSRLDLFLLCSVV